MSTINLSITVKYIILKACIFVNRIIRIIKIEKNNYLHIVGKAGGMRRD